MCDGFRRLANVYSYVEEIVCLLRNQVDLRLPQQKKMVKKELEQSLVLLDICIVMQENFAELKMTIQELQLVLNRGDDASINLKIESFIRSAKKIQKHFKKNSSKATSKCFSLVMLLAEAREMAVSVLESTSCLLPKQIATSNSSKWSLVSKKYQKRKVVCEAE